MNIEDYIGIQQVIARYGHAIDSAPHELGHVFTSDAVLDASQAGGVITKGFSHLLENLIGTPTLPAPEDGTRRQPAISHHFTNTEGRSRPGLRRPR